jgi:hypothetical protein
MPNFCFYTLTTVATDRLVEDGYLKSFLDKLFGDSRANWLKPLVTQGCSDVSSLKSPVLAVQRVSRVLGRQAKRLGV